MQITRNDDGTLLVPVTPERAHVAEGEEPDTDEVTTAPSTRLLHPGEGGYDEALAEWDLQQHAGESAVSTADGRQEAIALVHNVANGPDDSAAAAMAELDDPGASAEALRHVLVGGVHSVEAFATEVSEATGEEPIPAHQATKIIGEILAELD